jgi:hypothetical protein
MNVLERMRFDLVVAFENARQTVISLTTRGQRLERLADVSHALDVDTDLFRQSSLGVIDRRAVTRYWRLCWFDVDFRRAAFLVLSGVVLFCLVVILHWSFIVQPERTNK